MYVKIDVHILYLRTLHLIFEDFLRKSLEISQQFKGGNY